MKLILADVFDLDREEREAVEIAQSWKVFSRVSREVSHSITQIAGMPQGTNVFEEVGLGSREDDAFHPSPVGDLVELNRIEEASLAWLHPPSCHQSACD